MSDRQSLISVELAEGLHKLGLTEILQRADEMFLRARVEHWTPEQLLENLIEAELAAREIADLRDRLERAHFPTLKTLEGFDLEQSSISPERFSYLESLKWIAATENLVLVGPAGTGKTHLAIVLGYKAVQSGIRVRFFTAVELVEQLYRALADNSIKRVIDDALEADLIILDEMGFAPLDDTGCQLLFRFVAAAYERRSLAVTSHWPFESWGRFLPERTTAVSLLDRLVHHSVIIVTKGESFRLREARSRERPWRSSTEA